MSTGSANTYNTITQFTEVIADGWTLTGGTTFSNPNSGIYSVSYNIATSANLDAAGTVVLSAHAQIGGTTYSGSQESVTIPTTIITTSNIGATEVSNTFILNYTGGTDLTFQWGCFSTTGISLCEIPNVDGTSADAPIATVSIIRIG